VRSFIHFKGFILLSPRWIDRPGLEGLEKMDELFTEENPTRGTRRLSKALKKRFELVAGRNKVRHLMDMMGIAGIYPKKICPS